MTQSDLLPLDGVDDDTRRDSKSNLETGRTLPAGFTFGQIVRIDPALCDICPFNGRANSVFDPTVNHALIDNIRNCGQQVPVILRAASAPERLELVAGTRRLGAVRYLRAFDSRITLLAEIRDITDQEAWTIAEAENADRSDMSQLERARNWRHALEKLFGGNQTAMAQSLGVDKSVVSRMIVLADIPGAILDLVVRPDTINVHFAEQLAPSLNDPDRRRELLALASNLADAGMKLPPAELARRLLLTPAEAEAFRPVPIKVGRHERQAVWRRKPNGSSQLTIRPIPEELSKEDRKRLCSVLVAKIREHIERS